MEQTTGSFIQSNVPHSALTHWVRRSTRSMSVLELKQVLRSTSVSPYLGALPRALRARVNPTDIAAATSLFRTALDEFIGAHIREIMGYRFNNVYELPDVGALFDTPCLLECRNRPLRGDGALWYGAFGVVCCISFPEIGARYALKLFRSDDVMSAHGPWYEIPNALCAYHAEPRDNVRMHMASLGDIKYMLSDWIDGTATEPLVRPNQNAIFVTADLEMHSGNFRAGRRLDFGKTYRSLYGAASYNARKQYRIIVNLVDHWSGRVGAARTMGIVSDYINVPRDAAAARDVADAVQLLRCCGPLRCLEFVGPGGGR